MKTIAMFPGTFDPPTLGHIDIIERCASMYDGLYVVIGDNRSKSTMFTADERKTMLCNLLKAHENVKVEIWDGLTVGFAASHDVSVMVRGVRGTSDFEYEFNLAQINRQISPDIETVFMPCKPEFLLVRSSTIKEMASFGADISGMVPEQVCQAVINKVKC